MVDRPAVVIHTAVSLDGAVTGFAPDLGVHYAAAATLGCDGHLVGSLTMLTGLQSEGVSQPQPDLPDSPPAGRKGAPYWFLVDPGGKLYGLLHAVRAFPGLRDVVVLIARSTPQEYRKYLGERGYPTLEAGEGRVDLAGALDDIGVQYGVRRLMVDSGPGLTRALLDAGLVDEVSVLLHPLVVGAEGRRAFEGSSGAALELQEQRQLDGGVLHARYRVSVRARG
jgi:2,5-diamino-6-(ribosylamino)-4(3H)-pyrimidinone 5'-phosphate reductase